MTVRGTLALAAVFVALACYVWLSRTLPTSDGAMETRLTGPLDAATSVEMTRGTATARFMRRDGSWSAPGVDDLLQALGSLQVLGVIDPSPSDPESYGLGADALRLRVTGDRGELAAIDVGSMNPAGTGVYVRQAGRPPVLLVGALLQWELEKLRRVASATALP